MPLLRLTLPSESVEGKSSPLLNLIVAKLLSQVWQPLERAVPLVYCLLPSVALHPLLIMAGVGFRFFFFFC